MTAWILAGASALAYTPKDPKVKALVDRGVNYIEANVDKLKDGQDVDNLGGRAMLAYAIFKSRHKEDHPLVQSVVAEVRQFVAGKTQLINSRHDYSYSALITLLSEMDDPSVRPLIGDLYARLLASQRPDGSWSYASLGDTSVTQYGMLASWTVRQLNDSRIVVPNASVEKAANWLLRTQSPSGSFGYAGKDPGSYNRIQQDRTTLSMLAAGAGSLYMAANLLDFRRAATAGDAGPEFIAVDPLAAAPGSPTTTAFPHKLMWDSLQLADASWAQRFDILNDGPQYKGQFQCYYLYSMERYMSFRSEVLNQKDPENGANWYNAGVDFLARTQQANGSWNFKSHYGPEVSTAFAVLFLMRSTQEKIFKASAAGQARGGYGIPESFQTARLTDDGEVVSSEKKDVVKDFTALLETLNAEEIPDNVDLSGLNQEWVRDKTKLEKLKEQVRSNPNYKARQLVVRQFAANGGIDNVPILIFALSDPAWQVVLEARNGLRRISHRIGGFGLSDNPSEAEKEEAQRRWSRWYLSVRPDGEL